MKGKILDIWRINNNVYGNPRYLLTVETENNERDYLGLVSYQLDTNYQGANIEYKYSGRGIKNQGRYFNGANIYYLEKNNQVKWDHR